MEKRKIVRNIEKQNSMFLTKKNRFFSLQLSSWLIQKVLDYFLNKYNNTYYTY